MLMLRQLAIFIFPVLLTGCLTKECPRPGSSQPCGGDPCYYKLHVQNITPDSGGYTVTGVLPRTTSPTYDFHVNKADGDKLKANENDPTFVYPFRYTCGETDLRLYPGKVDHFLRP